MSGPSPAVAAQREPEPVTTFPVGPVLVVGAGLWYWPNAKECDERTGGTVTIGGMWQNMHGSLGAQPLRCSVDYVNTDGTVNVTITDHIGRRHVRMNVRIAPNDAPAPDEHHGYAVWPLSLSARDFQMTG